MTKRELKILLVNDDGVMAPGLHALYEELKNFHDVKIVAPDTNRTGAGHAISLNRPLYLHQHSENIFSVDGTPVDCVYLALTALTKEWNWTPDIVLSGINDACNLGTDIFYSGTVNAALEGMLFGYCSIAISLNGKTSFKAAAEFAGVLVDAIDIRPGLLNVNVPDIPAESIKGVRVSTLGKRNFKANKSHKHHDPRCHSIYWVGALAPPLNSKEANDLKNLYDGFITITPLHSDLTDYTLISDLTKKFNCDK